MPGRGPMEVLADLLAGNRRFAGGRPRYGHHVTSPNARRAIQTPEALVIGCLDSRVPPEAILDQDFGVLVVVRTGGHVLDQAGLGSVEFAVGVLKVPLVLVLGHQYCGAVATAMEAVESECRPGGELGRLVARIEPAVLDIPGGGDDLAERVERRHVTRTVEMVSALDVARSRLAAGELAVVGARYTVDTGQVSLVNP